MDYKDTLNIRGGKSCENKKVFLAVIIAAMVMITGIGAENFTVKAQKLPKLPPLKLEWDANLKGNLQISVDGTVSGNEAVGDLGYGKICISLFKDGEEISKITTFPGSSWGSSFSHDYREWIDESGIYEVRGYRMGDGNRYSGSEWSYSDAFKYNRTENEVMKPTQKALPRQLINLCRML